MEFFVSSLSSFLFFYLFLLLVISLARLLTLDFMVEANISSYVSLSVMHVDIIDINKIDKKTTELKKRDVYLFIKK